MPKKKRVKKIAIPRESSSRKRSYVKQTDIPSQSINTAIKLAKALFENFASKPTPPHQIASALDLSPTGILFRCLCGASIGYGLTDGGSSATLISLTELGKKVTAPTEEGLDVKAKVESVLRPSIAKLFFEQYNRAKFPQDRIARNVLLEKGVPQDRLDRVLSILKENGKSVGIIHDTKTGPYVAIDVDVPQTREDEADEADVDLTGQAQERDRPDTQVIEKPSHPPAKPRVFIAHGKNKEIVTQLKDLLKFGKFEPIVAEEHETTSLPVPEKVMDEMRSCMAGIIHIESEEALLDHSGGVHHKMNENVLIEIGAAMALYRGNFILLVQKGIHLPSNLRGLYECRYEGKHLDYDATMKLLKAFNEFK